MQPFYELVKTFKRNNLCSFIKLVNFNTADTFKRTKADTVSRTNL